MVAVVACVAAMNSLVSENRRDDMGSDATEGCNCRRAVCRDVDPFHIMTWVGVGHYWQMTIDGFLYK